MTTNNPFCEITPELEHLSQLSAQCASIEPELYTKYDVKRGLRDLNGKGVLVGLTEISDVCSTKIVNGESVPADGELYYRGYNVKDIISGIDESVRIRGMYVSPLIRKTSNEAGTKEFHCDACPLPISSDEFCP